jgi:hypothetical protein
MLFRYMKHLQIDKIIVNKVDIKCLGNQEETVVPFEDRLRPLGPLWLPKHHAGLCKALID